ncbi:MAG: hypothetical protein OEX19_14415 [Gammaproteobacteria bacterium]|nr:hypothetical protein [Gammaproteobacteria bacterium]
MLLLRPRFWMCLVVCLSSSFVIASDDNELNKLMSQIGTDMVGLYPIVVSADLPGEKDKAQIRNKTASLLEAFRKAGPFFGEKSKTYKLSYSLILDYLENTQRAIDGNKWQSVTLRLSSLGEICTSCHTQDTKLRSLYAGTGRGAFPNDLAYAEFNYFTRNYMQAERFYARFLENAGKQDDVGILLVFQRLITIYAQIYNLPGDGADKLQAFLLKLEGKGVKTEPLVPLVFGMKNLQKSGLSKVDDVDFSDLKKYVRKYLGPLDGPLSSFIVRPEEEVERVWLRGLLFHYLNRQPSNDEIPQILFWLSVTDRSLNYNYFYSLADMYLKECVYSYKEHPYAEKCYDEYREYMLFSYTGSAGEFLPPEVESELKDLRERIDAKD